MKISDQRISEKLTQRWLAVAMLAAVLLAATLLFIVPLVNKGLELNETKKSLAFRLQQYERILANKEAVLDGVANIKEQDQEQGYFNSQGTDALASAEMQEFIKKAITDAGGQLSSTQSIPVSDKGDFIRISVRVRMTGNSEVLRSVLYKIETATPLIIIDQIDVRPIRGRRSSATRQIEPSNELSVNFQAVTFMRKQPHEQ
jgi:general secretion pathway protein M